jgi:hypothetical protein
VGGTAPYTFTYRINGGINQTVTTTSGNSVSLSALTGSPGTFIYSLVSVQESSGTACSNAASATATITVNPLPFASISGSTTICQNSTAPLITFSGVGGTAPYTFFYKINNGPLQSIVTSSGNSVTVTVPTSTPGTFIYSLVSVQESSRLTCSNTASASATVTVKQLATAGISGGTTICQNDSQPRVTFSATGGVRPYTFVYQINGGTNQTISTTTDNNISVSVPTTTPGAYSYSLISVQESSSISCLNLSTGTILVTVNPLPTASITGTIKVCQNAASPFVTFTGSGATAPYTFTYKINGGPARTVNSIKGNSVSIAAPTNIPGLYKYNLIGVQESSSTSCSNSVTDSATVTVNELATASISGTKTVCQKDTSPKVTFTAAGGTGPYVFTYNINGGTPVSVVTSSGLLSVSVDAPTNIVGKFTYNLLSIKESSVTACLNAATGSITVTVNELATASIAGTDTVCQNDAARLITFSGKGGVAPYTFTYKINGGVSKTVKSNNGNTATIIAPTNIAGTFIYSLISVQESSGLMCINTVFDSATIAVNPQPKTAVIETPLAHLCNGVFTQLKVKNYDSSYTYTWYLDGNKTKDVKTDTVMVAKSGTYTVLATSDKGCKAANISNPLKITTGSISKPIITGVLQVCTDGKSKLIAIPTDSTLRYTGFVWTEELRTSTLSTDSFYYAAKGQFKVTVEREKCYDTAMAPIVESDTLFPKGQLKITPLSLKYGEQANILAEVNNASKYRWDFGDGNKTANATNKMLHNYFVSGDSIPIQVWAISERNCITKFVQKIKVARKDSAAIPDFSFTGNVKDWNIFPSPFKDHLKVSVILQKTETVKIDMFTPDGSWLRTWSFSGAAGENLFSFDKLYTLPGAVTYLFVGWYNGENHFAQVTKL